MHRCTVQFWPRGIHILCFVFISRGLALLCSVWGLDYRAVAELLFKDPISVVVSGRSTKYPYPPPLPSFDENHYQRKNFRRYMPTNQRELNLANRTDIAAIHTWQFHDFCYGFVSCVSTDALSWWKVTFFFLQIRPFLINFYVQNSFRISKRWR